jgi:hypothetical protein
LKRTAQDGKALYGFDRAQQAPLKTPTEYFLSAVENVRSSKAKYAEAEERANRSRPQRPSWFAPHFYEMAVDGD